MAERIDKEVSSITDRAYKTAKEILEMNKKHLDRIAEMLQLKETLNGKELRELLEDEPETIAA